MQDLKKHVYTWALMQEEFNKDSFLRDQYKWELCRDYLVSKGCAIGSPGFDTAHDVIKDTVGALDKQGMLGGIAKGQSYSERLHYNQKKAENRRSTGHPQGVDGWREDANGWAKAIRPPRLQEYYESLAWRKRSRQYRESVNWQCELCLKSHAASHSTLVTHHKHYDSAMDGTESDWMLMAVCADLCHDLADLARYVRSGSLPEHILNAATEPLLCGVRSGRAPWRTLC